MNKDNVKPLKSTSYLNSIVRHTRLMKGGFPVLKRFKQKPVLYMSQFKQPPVVVVVPDTMAPTALECLPTPNKLIKIRVSNTKETIIVDLVVKYCGELVQTSISYLLDLIIDPERPIPLSCCEMGISIGIPPIKGSSSAHHCDPGFSGYILMYALYNEGIHLDMMIQKDRSKLLSFVSSIASSAGSEINRQEFVITADYLRKNPFTLRMPKTSCLWLLPHDIMLFDDAPRCIFWESASIRGDMLKTVMGLNTDDLRNIRNLPHAVLDNSEYSFLSLPYEVDPVKILNPIASCFLQILEDVSVGTEKEQYLGTIDDEYE
jgi:hypothetical protein